MQFSSKAVSVVHRCQKIRGGGGVRSSSVRFVAEFGDTEELSQVLSGVDVHSIQLNKGGFRAKLDKRVVEDWDVQSIEFFEGKTSCSGSAARTTYTFLVPLQLGPECRLLGKPLTRATIGIYSPSSEHADVSSAGLSEFVIAAPVDFLERAEREEVKCGLPRQGSDCFTFPPGHVALLRAILKFSSSAMNDGARSPEVARNFSDLIERALFHVLSHNNPNATNGRPRVSREDMHRRVSAAIEEAEDGVLFQTELAKSLDVSLATLHRFFIDWFGLPPSRYLLSKRLYLARRRLSSGEYATVTDVATSCGFWEFGRFSARYREQFGELPSETLKRNRA